MQLINEFIELNPNVMLGKPVIKGTRITVELILEKLAADESIEDILVEHPKLNREQILAALAYISANFKVSHPAEKRPKYDFSNLFGRLQWKGDAVAEQRRMRDEW